MLSENAVARLLLRAAQGDAKGARAYLGTMLPRSMPCAGVREIVIAGLSANAVTFLDAALPWLASLDPLGPVVEKGGPRLASTEPRDVRALLDAAGWAGLRRSGFTDAEIASLDEVAEFVEATGGRPRRMVRLKLHDPQHNVFARPA